MPLYGDEGDRTNPMLIVGLGVGQPLLLHFLTNVNHYKFIPAGRPTLNKFGDHCYSGTGKFELKGTQLSVFYDLHFGAGYKCHGNGMF